MAILTVFGAWSGIAWLVVLVAEEPALEFQVRGDRTISPIKVPCGKHQLQFALNLSGSRCVNARNIAINFSPEDGVMLSAKKQFGTEIQMGDDYKLPYRYEYPDSFTLTPHHGIGLAVEYDAKCSSKTFVLDFEAIGSICDWEKRRFTGMYAPKVAKISKRLEFAPVGYPNMPPADLLRLYGLRIPPQSALRMTGEAATLGQTAVADKGAVNVKVYGLYHSATKR